MYYQQEISSYQVIEMKIDRILGIIIYLLNHDKVSAKTLAEKYNVSVRTI